MAYGKLAPYYDRLTRDLPYDRWLEFVRQCWTRYGFPDTVADLGCGTGNIALPLVEQGLTVIGIDRSEDMLSIARHKWEQRSKRLRTARHRDGRKGKLLLSQQDMTGWSVPEPVDSVLIFCDGLNYVTEEAGVISTFLHSFRALNKGGLFIFDVHTPFRIQAMAESQPFFLDDEDIAYIWTCALNQSKSEIRHELTVFARESGDRFRRFEEVHIQRAYPPEWLKRELLKAGYASVEMYSDFTFRPLHEKTERAFFVARKGF